MKKSASKPSNSASAPKLSPLAKVTNAAMRKAARQVAAENKRLGLPLIAIKATP